MNELPRIVLVLIAVFLAAGCGNSEPGRVGTAETIVLAHAMHPSHPVSVAIRLMADSLETISGGRLSIRIYPAGQLGSERKLIELIQLGMVGMTKVSAATLEGVVPAMRVFGLPYLYRDKAHADAVVFGEVGRRILAEGDPYRLKGIDYYDAGSRSIYTVGRSVRSPQDLKGLKIRVMESATAMSLMRTMGGSPTPLAWGELYTAFQGGIVDGAENNLPSFLTSRHYEVCRYYSVNEHATIPDVLVMDTRLWDQLDERQRHWLMKAVEISVEHQRVLWKAFEADAMRTVREAGVNILYPNIEPFRAATEPMYDRIRRQDPQLHAWVEAVRAVTPFPGDP